MENNVKTNRFKTFLSKNKYFILMAICILAIVAMITLTALNARADQNVNANNPPVVDPNTNDPIINNPDDGNEQTGQPSLDGNDQQTGTDAIVFTLPVENGAIGQGFANDTLVFSATLNQWQTHEAMDILAEPNSKVVACLSGTVSDIKTSPLKGTQVTLKHANGLETTYCLLSDDVKVTLSQYVSVGDEIGTITDKSNFESHLGAHLHLEVKKDGVLVDPMYYLPSDNK